VEPLVESRRLHFGDTEDVVARVMVAVCLGSAAVYVVPDPQPQSGRIVVARRDDSPDDDGEVVVRHLVRRGGGAVLRAANARYADEDPKFAGRKWKASPANEIKSGARSRRRDSNSRPAAYKTCALRNRCL
jgi:hypothetical protein